MVRAPPNTNTNTTQHHNTTQHKGGGLPDTHTSQAIRRRERSCPHHGSGEEYKRAIAKERHAVARSVVIDAVLQTVAGRCKPDMYVVVAGQWPTKRPQKLSEDTMALRKGTKPRHVGPLNASVQIWMNSSRSGIAKGWLDVCTMEIIRITHWNSGFPSQANNRTRSRKRCSCRRVALIDGHLNLFIRLDLFKWFSSWTKDMKDDRAPR